MRARKSVLLSVSVALMIVALLATPGPAMAKATKTEVVGTSTTIGMIDPGVWTTLPSGNVKVRDMILVFREEMSDPRASGTNTVVMNANWDSDETGPEQDTETALTACFDFNGNGAVDIGDIMQVAVRWLLTAANPDPDNNPATPNYEDKYDANGDGVINVVDIMMVAAQWGQTCP